MRLLPGRERHIATHLFRLRERSTAKSAGDRGVGCAAPV